MSRTLSVALASAASLALLAPAALAAPNDDATEAAAGYIADNLDPETAGTGGTADAVLALLAAGGHEDRVVELVETLEAQAADYAVTGPAAGKLALVAAATGAEATDFGGVDLLAVIQDSITEDGACDAGFPSAFGNAWCIIGLDRNDADVPDELLASSFGFQDAATGAFGFEGDEGFVADADSTGLMLNALSGVASDREAALSAAAARDYLVEAQTDEGYWEGYVPVNTTGLVAPALQTVGVDIDTTVEWVVDQQLEDGGLTAEIGGEQSDLMATTQGILPLAGESYLSVGEGGTDSVDLDVRPDRVTRVAGDNRYETAAAASARSFQPVVDTVYVATGQDYADALTGSALAGHQHAPVLLVQENHVPTATATELRRLDAGSVVVLGGDVAVSDEVVEELAEAAGTEVTRLEGKNRYETAANVAREFTDVDHVFVATGTEYADALAASAAAGADGVPVLLVNEGGVPDAAEAYLEDVKPSSVTVLGGTKAVSEDTIKELGDYVETVERVAGDNRYETAAALSAQRGESDGVVLATGQDFPDALTGAAYAAMGEDPVLLVQQDRVPNASLAEFDRLAARTVLVLGGSAAVSDTVVELVRQHNYAG